MNGLGVSGEGAFTAPRANIEERVLRGQVLGRLRALGAGRVTVLEGGRRHEFGAPADDGLEAVVRVHDPRFFTAVALGGSVGAGESFMAGHWDADDLVAVVRLLVRNRAALDGLEGGLARAALPLLRAAHRMRRNDTGGSRANIAAHYDLGNDFYALWLDETLTYSCACFEHPQATLAEAQRAKLDRVCRKLALGPGDHVLEIGTGWGAFALHAAGTYGCRVTTTTISRAQHELATERVRAAGLEDRVEVLLRDYRELSGRYDKLVSIEMIEAVGHEFLDVFLGRCAELLHERGLMCLQSITIADRHHDAALRSVDFIQRHVFPGCYIPSLGSLTAALGRSGDLGVVHLEDIGLHYARTLRHWRERFLARQDEVRALGRDTTFLRLWEFYLAYCEGGFAERQISDVQLVLAKPRATVPPAPAALAPLA